MIHATKLSIKDSSTDSPCPHLQRAFYRYPHRLGSGFRVIELCRQCGQNTRGVAIWVSRDDVRAAGLDPEALPVVPSKASKPEPSLFDAASGEGGTP